VAVAHNESETRVGLRTDLQSQVEQWLRFGLGKRLEECGPQDVYRALAYALRPPLLEGAERTEKQYSAVGAKRVYYLSAEFLIGQSLRNNLFNLQQSAEAARVAQQFGFDLEEILSTEPDAGLGNGGLGRLAACYLESLATQGFPGFGYGINYEFGLFKQEIQNGRQQEKPDNWLKDPSPWEIARMDEACMIPVYGRIEHSQDLQGGYNPMWVDWQVIVGVPHDIPIAGFGGRTVNRLRLYSARSSDDFDMKVFNEGDYLRAVEQKIASETISKVLYPSDSFAAGKELRLVQEYFLVASALRDIFRHYLQSSKDLNGLPRRVAIQMNDTHPSLVVAELMRLLVDEHSVPWERAWEITRATCAFTNHTLMPEALETWPVELLEKTLPRHLQIIYEINSKFLQDVSRRFPGDAGRQSSMSLIEEGPFRQVRMAHLAIVGSHAINGVAELHSDLVKTSLVPDFFALWPERFTNVTNGVTHRRWVAAANPALAGFLTKYAGPGWETDFARVATLDRYAERPEVQDEFLAIKRANKDRLASVIRKELRLSVDPDSMFDVHVKRMHEYKRQLLNVLRVIHAYRALVEDGVVPPVPRTVIFAGKAAPGYHMAKQIIKLIHNVAARVNGDPAVNGRLRVIFLPNYRVTLAETIIPAADLSEQISTAGTEASGTSNMKFAMNGALTIGTLDGANVEIRSSVGPENFYLFGLTTEQVAAQRPGYRSRELYEASPVLRRAVDSLLDERFCPGEPGIFQDVYDLLVHHGDHYMHLADFHSYLDAQARADQDFRDRHEWAKKAILNVARSTKFTSDRSVRDYAKNIWSLAPVEVPRDPNP
jgi:starch phosphorylase